MPELIDRKYLLAYLAEIKPDEYVSAFGEAAVQVIGLIEEFVKEMPTIETEQRRGRWIALEGWFNKSIVKCSVCGNTLDMDGVNAGRGDANFCPKCGARMDGGAKNEAD